MTEHDKEYLLMKAEHHRQKSEMFRKEFELHKAKPRFDKTNPRQNKLYWAEYNRLRIRMIYHAERAEILTAEAEGRPCVQTSYTM